MAADRTSAGASRRATTRANDMRRIAEPKRRNVIRMAGLDLTGAWLIVRCRLVAKGC
jgi:hypothetical protein